MFSLKNVKRSENSRTNPATRQNKVDVKEGPSCDICNDEGYSESNLSTDFSENRFASVYLFEYHKGSQAPGC